MTKSPIVNHRTIFRPFLKWAGGKTRLMRSIQQQLPHGRTLIEPFLGSGAVFLNTDFEHYILADINSDLITLYQMLQQQGRAFIEQVRPYFTEQTNQKKKYYLLRERFNITTDPIEKSALFVYLNRHGYNGLCRYNFSGQFNVPFGRYKKPYFPEAEMIYFYHKSRHVTFVCASYEKIFQRARKNHVVYCDPPYSPLSETAYFTRYSAYSFGETDQMALATQAEKLSRRGVPVLISNHDTELTRRLYANAKLTSFSVSRHISCKSAQRIPVKELLALFLPD